MSEAPAVSIVSPVYGCTECLVTLYERTRDALASVGASWELVLVDDRGPGEPWAIIEKLAARDARVRGVRLSRNEGQHIAIWAGLAHCRGRWAAVVDCDLQDDPGVIPKLLAAANAGEFDAIVVDRGRWSDSIFRRLASKSVYWLIEKLGGVRLENIGNFGVYSRRMIEALLQFREQEVFLPMMIAITGLPRTTLTVSRSSRLSGKSSYNLLRLARLAIAIIIRDSDRPLKLSVIVGATMATISALISIVLVIGRLTATFTVEGWTSTMLSLWFLAGIILATLGIHGFYIGRVFSEVKARPRFFVESQTYSEEVRAG